MKGQHIIRALILIVLAGILLLVMRPGEDRGAPGTESAARVTAQPAAETAGPVTAPQEIADYILLNGRLPDNFITKDEAVALGWNAAKNDVSDVAPGKSIGGDRFGNYEGRLPQVRGRRYYEADCNYTGGPRGGERIVYSDDGHVWYTPDHYQTFTELFLSGQEDGL